MPNLVLTDLCNRKCPYCFAQQTMAGAGDRHLSIAEIVAITDKAVESRVQRIGLLGGEPSLHPDFVNIIHYLLARRLRVTVFTNGLCSGKTLSELAAIPPDARVAYVVNVNHPEITKAEESSRQHTFLKTLGPRCEVSLNLYRLDLDPCFVADLGVEGGTSRRVRLGLAQPIANASNVYIDKDFYQQAAPLIVRLVKACFEKGGNVYFDCGFPLCMFDDEQLGALRRCGTTPRFTCQSAVDLARGGQTWACFPLAETHRFVVSPEMTLSEVRRAHQASMQRTRERTGAWGIFGGCDECAYRKARVCDGGCLSHALRALGG